jgi:membrane protease YdiL (CAAX protease family)
MAVTPADYPGCPATVTDALAAGRVLRPVRWGLWGVVGGLAATVAIAVVVGVLLLLADAPLSVQILVGVSAPWLAMLGWPLLATRLRGNGPVIDLGLRLTWRDTGWGVIAGVAATFAAGIAAALMTLVVPDLTSAAGDAAAELQDAGGRLGVVLFGLMVLIGAPIVEEVFFRGYAYGALRKRGLNAFWTIVITAVVFAGFHLEPMRFLILLPTGLVLGWVRWHTGSTGAAMVAHGVVNAPGAVLLLLGIEVVSP